MNKIIPQQLIFTLLILFILLTPFVFFNFISDGDSISQIVSVELGVSSLSPSGVSGGAVIPASCGSPHVGDLCTTPDFDGCQGSSCDPFGGGGGPNITINTGDDVSLAWTCADSSSSSGINFSTGGATFGTSVVSPTSNTTYTLLCSNGGQGSVVVTVLNPVISISATPSLLQLGDTSSIAWTATSVNSCAVSEDSLTINDSWTGTSGTQTSSPITEETVYSLSCLTDGGSVSDSVTVRLVPIFQEF